MRILLLVCIFISASLYCADTIQDVKIPEIIKSDLSKFDSEVYKSWQIYNKSVDKIKNDLKINLQKKMKEAMTKGDLESANTIKKQIDSIDAYLIDIEKTFRNKSDDLLGEKVITDKLIGKWGTNKDIIWEFSIDGTGKHYWQGVVYTLKWSKSKNNDYDIILNGPSPNRKLVLLNAKQISILPGTFERIDL